MEQEPYKKPIRYYEIDALRFLAAISVVIFHLTFRGYAADNLSPVAYPSIAEFTKYGYLGVELFFMISGYVIFISAYGKTVKKFFVSRISRLYPAYWAACTITFLIVRLLGPKVGEAGWSSYLDTSFTQYLYNLTMLQSFFGVRDLDGVYWTLSYEIVFYFLISLLIGYNLFSYIIPILTSWLLYAAAVGPIIGGNAFAMLLFPRFSPFFIAGIVFYLIQINYTALWKLYTLLFCCLILSLRSMQVSQVEISAGFHEEFSLSVLLTIVTLFYIIFWLIIKRIINLNRWHQLAWLGALTYPLYLVHHSIGYTILKLFGNRINKYLLLTGLIFGALLLAYGIYTIIEKRYAKLFAVKFTHLLEK